MNRPRVLIGAVSSNCGKTTITCGILQALVNRKLKVTSFKCGPDYIDPMFHSKIIGTKSRNLDPFFFDEKMLNDMLYDNATGSDISVIEGVMGFYDGLGGTTNKASTYELCVKTDTPAILVVDVKGMSYSVLAQIKGFLELEKDNTIKGVILNKISPMLYPSIKKLIEETLNIRVFGYLPFMKESFLESRHLGLVTAMEVDELQEKVQLLATQVEKSVDVDGIIELANSTSDIECKLEKQVETDRVNIALAYDKAFCFYYEDSLDLLRKKGANIVTFSPLDDKGLPTDIDAIIIGGGYPELYAKKLSQNKSMLESIRIAILEKKLPTVAECGGFMYLHEELEDDKSESYSMVGAIKAKSYKTEKLSRFGYIEITANVDNILCKKGDSIRAHEFHYWDSTFCGDSFTAKKPVGKRGWDCIVTTKNLFAGYPHMHFYSNESFADNFILSAKLSRKERL